MNYRAHLAAGTVSFFVVLFLAVRYGDIGFFLAVLSYSVCMFFSLFPDVDTRRSKIHRLLLHVSIVLTGISLLLGFGAVPSVFMILWLVAITKLKHRGFLHSFTAAVSLPSVVGLISYYTFGTFLPAVFGFAGYFSHLLLDGKA
ncbi:MAG: hypothetical protein GXO63_03335 [Candidatus Micrarchaeota archaeon]|nr:hypothetical protein [Candidatus Micrarchaeota archaeon]